MAVEEYELLLSFKGQLNAKIEQFYDINKLVEDREKDLLNLNSFYINEKGKCQKQLDELKIKIKTDLCVLTN